MKTVRIAQFGAFDIQSLGDSCFPKVLRKEMQDRINCDIELFSLNHRENTYNDNFVYSYEEFLDRNKYSSFDAIVIGGGELLHNKPIHFKDNNGKDFIYPEGYIWQYPLRLGEITKIPSYINCLGAPYDFLQDEKDEMSQKLSSAALISVRDEFSYCRLKELMPSKEVLRVADNLWQIDHIYSAGQLSSKRKEIAKRINMDLSEPYIVVQYGTAYQARQMGEVLQKIKLITNMNIYLMPINYCHEDRQAMQTVEKFSNGCTKTINEYFQPMEMIAVLSGASLFIGTSLHGNLITMLYGGNSIGIDMYPNFVSKMDGLFSMLNIEKYLLPSVFSLEDAVKSAITEKEAGYEAQRRIGVIKEELARYFDRLAKSIEENSIRTAKQ